MRKWPVVLFSLVLSPVAAGAADDAPGVTFTEDIAPLVFQNCATCHRPGQVAPFSLLTYADTRKHAKTMVRVMKDRYMPPWQPEPGYGQFQGERRLTDAQIALFDKWVRTGMAEGDAKKAPPLPTYPEGWQIGQPDLVVKMDRPFDVPADGADIYQNFVIPLGLTEDKWVTAVEFRASAPQVVHHVLYFLDNSGRARARVPKEGQPGFAGMGFRPTGRLGGWAVGAKPVGLPNGLALPLPKGSDLVLQTHLHPSGKAVKEMLTVGLYFADRPSPRTVLTLPLPPAFGLFSNIDIPAGRADFKVTDSFTLPVDVDLFGVGAHAHYLGKTMKATARLPGGGERKLFSIRDWDFNWQGLYVCREYVRLPKGTVIRADLTWDNSAENSRNPTSPPIRVRWGEGSTDEMGQVSLMMVAADEGNTAQLRNAIVAHVRQTAIRSRIRGDKIDWGKLGIEPPALWKDSPGDPKKKDPKGLPLSLRDLHGKEQMPLKVDGAKAHVLFFVTTDCPIANSYAPEISALVKDFSQRPIRFYAVHVDPELNPDAARRHAREYGLTLPILIDTKHQLVSATGATRTPEVAVLLPNGTLAYRGRIDDRYPGLGKKRQAPSQRDLRDALSAILAGESVQISRTEAVGCSIPERPQKWQAMLGEFAKTEKADFGGLCGIAVEPATGIVWINLSDRGFYRSDDQARTFKRAGSQQPRGRTETPGCLLFDPSGKTRHVVTALVYGSPIAVSKNQGVTWKLMDARSTHVDWCAVDWTDPDMKFVLAMKHEAGGMLLISRDGGATFAEVGKGYGPGWVFDAQTAVVAQVPAKDRPTPRLLRTTDGGKSWEPCATYRPVGTESTQALPRWHEDKLYWLVQGALISSDNKGATWQQIAAVKDGRYGPVFGKSSQHMFLLTKAGIVESTDGGATWSNPIIPPAPALKGIHGLTWLAYDPTSDVLYLMTMGSDLFKLERKR